VNERELFIQAIQIEDSAARTVYLDQACGADAALRQRVDALLNAFEQAGSFLQHAAADPPSPRVSKGQAKTIDEPVSEGPGTIVGPFKLIEQIGEGGMGTVWMAQQTVPVKRIVALKLIKAGMDSKQFIARFEAERQALALMDHPNIARVLDGGATSAGRPYFVMDLVKGVPITKYCDEHHLTPRQRLELFLPICQAVQHAHQKGIIHRDLKPSNVLVALYDGKPVPKVIDFGVAKAAGQQLTDKTLVTGFGSIVGTLEYMSPEQAELNQLDIDTRSDIYSLGVLLYELLAGSPPFERKRLERAGMLEMLRVIREQEPSKPSTKLSTADGLPTLAANRGTEPAKLTKLLRGELDWIVMKALEKDRNRRYETANGFAADLQRYLSDEPVHACPPSAAYRFRKFARRNKAALAMASVIAGALVTAVVGLSVSNLLVALERDEKTQALTDKEKALVRESAALTKAKDQEALANERAEDAKQQQTIASAQELLARRRFYAAQMNLAMQAWQNGMLPRVLELLEGQRPGAEQEDLRGFEWFYLWRLCHSGQRVSLHGHLPGFAISSVAFSPDGTTLASASWEGWIRLWDAATGQERKRLRGHSPRFPWEVAFSPDGKTLASGGQESGTLILWDVSTGMPLHTIPNSVVGLAFSPDGQTLAAGAVAAGGVHDGGSATPDDRILDCATLWDVATAKEQVKLANAGLVVGFLPDGKTLVTATNQYQAGGKVEFWNLESKAQRLSIPVPGINNVALSRDGKQMATTDSRVIKVWDIATGKELAAFSEQRTRALAFSPDGKKLATGGESRTVSVWDLEISRRLAQEVHLDPVWAVAFSPDGKTLASSTLGGAIRLSDMTPPEEATTIRSSAGVMSLSFSTDGRTLMVGTNGVTKVIDVTVGKEQAELPMRGVTAISADGNTMAGGGDQDSKIVWDVRTGREIGSMQLPRINESLPGLTLSPDGKTLASFYPWHSDITVKLWDIATRQSRTLEPEPPQLNRVSVLCAAFSRDGKLLAAGFQFQSFIVWDVATGKVKLMLHQQPSMMNVISLAFSPDDKALAVGTDVGTVTRWEVETSKLLGSYKGHTDQVRSLAFSPDGKTLATAGADKTVRLWDVATGQERSTLTGHTSAVEKVAFDPTGNTLASASGDAVKLWRAATDPEALARRPNLDSDDPYHQLAFTYDRYSWHLSTTDDPLTRDPGRAVELSKKAVALAPHVPGYWRRLGVAHYHASEWREAITAFEKSEELSEGKFAAPNGFFRAIAHWRLDQKEEARSRYELACRWADQSATHDLGLHRLRVEAAKLLGLPIPPAPASLPPAAEEFRHQGSSK
jgi:WD40 repeat protein/serine/threonine protein kinase